MGIILLKKKTKKKIKFLCMTFWLWRLGLEDGLQSRCIYEAPFLLVVTACTKAKEKQKSLCGSMLGWNGGKGTGVRDQNLGDGGCDLQSIEVWRGYIDRPRQTATYHHFTGWLFSFFKTGRRGAIMERESTEREREKETCSMIPLHILRVWTTQKHRRTCVCVSERGDGHLIILFAMLDRDTAFYYFLEWKYRWNSSRSTTWVHACNIYLQGG